MVLINAIAMTILILVTLVVLITLLATCAVGIALLIDWLRGNL